MSDEGEDSPPRPKRKIKKVMVFSSASSSDSDDTGPTTSTRKKRLRVLSEDDSESSGSDVVCSRRTRALPKLRDSGSDSDMSGWATDDLDALKPSTSTSQPAKPTSGFASDSSEGNSDKCSICLMRFTEQEVGTPQNCEHIFCLDCITEWSKNVNTCPVDRITFHSIVVRTCAGGRVLRTEPVKVVERRSSVDLLVVEDPTVCEICGSSSSEDTMLLCDGCDLGYHMECLTPPLTEVPIDQWLCPNCDDLFDVIHLSEVNDLFSEIGDVDLDALVRPRPSVLRQPRNAASRRSSRLQSDGAGPSTSMGRRASGARGGAPSSRAAGSSTSRRRSTATHRTRRKKPTRRRTTVVIEYEVQENGKFPITRTIKRRVRKRKSRKVPRTAARRTQVRAGVRAQLARLAAGSTAGPPALAAPASLAVSRYRAGIPALSLFGSAHDLEYFSDEEQAATGGAAVAARPATASASARLDNYRQMKRKMVSLPSPPPAASAPDLLSSILESQTLLHSKRAVTTVTRDGSVDIKLPDTKTTTPAEPPKQTKSEESTTERVDVRKGAGESVKQAPAYGAGRGGGGGGWGGGYRGGYRREQTSPAYRHYDAARPHHPHHPSHPSHTHDEQDRYYPPPRRAPPFPPQDDPYYDRRRSDGPRPRPLGPPRLRPDAPHSRHSYGGFENPLDMRVGPPPPAQLPPQPQYMPMREPPSFNFGPRPAPNTNTNEIEEDERSDPDPDLVIDTEKYDPTEPTNDDDDSGEEDPPISAPTVSEPAPAPLPPPPSPPALPSAPTPPAPALNSASVLDSAVRAVLHEHRLLTTAPAPTRDHSDDDDDGDCPNFSIYSATSVHIANHSATMPSPPPAPALPAADEELADLVQEDASPPPPPALTPPKPLDQHSERVSKRCPITTNPRTPIKIKLNTPSLIKRQVSLYDEEEQAADVVSASAPDTEDTSPAETKTSEIPEESPAPTPPPPTPPHLDDELIRENGTPPHEKGDESPSMENAVEARTDELEEGEEEEEEEKEEEEKEEEGELKKDSGEESGAEEQSGDETDEEKLRPVEKMTESISETEDERSYTPCLDEHREPSAEPEPLAHLDTELISEDEGQGVFSEDEAPPQASPKVADQPAPDRDRKKKKKDAKREGRERKTKSKRDVAFKKQSKSGKERNYRERDKKRRASSESRSAARRRRDKRQDLERYDVRSVVGDKRRRTKDAFGRDVSPPPDAASPPAPPRRRPSMSPRRRLSGSPRRRPSASPRRRPTLSPRRRPSMSPRRRPTISPRRRPTISPRRRPTLSPRRRPSISPRRRPSISPRRRLSISPRRRPSISPRRRPSISPRRRPSISPRRRPSLSPRRRPSLSPRRRPSLSPRRRPSLSPRRRISLSPRRKLSPSPRRRASVSPRRKPTPSPARSAAGSAPSPVRGRRRGIGKKRRRSTSRARKRKRSASETSPKVAKSKKKKRARSGSRARRRSPRRRRRSASPALASPVWTGRPPSPRTPPAPQPAPPALRPERRQHRRQREHAGPSKEVFTSGDNILVSVSFKEQEEERGVRRTRGGSSTGRKRRRHLPDPLISDAKPVAIIDLDRSPFRELTPSPKNVIVLSDDEGREPAAPPPPAPAEAGAPTAPVAPLVAPAPLQTGPKTPPSPAVDMDSPVRAGGGAAATPPGGAAVPSSPDAYDPYEPTRSASPPPCAASPPRAPITLEAAQKTNMSADEVIDRRPLSPMEKVLALLASTRDVSPEPPPPPSQASPRDPAAPGPALPGPPTSVAPPAPRNPPKLFLAKPSPIKSDPIKPMQQATKISRLPLPINLAEAGGESPYSPGSSFGSLFSPRDAFDAIFDKPRQPSRKRPSAKVTPKPKPKKGKTQVDVKMDDDNLKVAEELPSSAVEMQVKHKFLKKLNRQERVVEEVKLVLKPHYNKKHVSKDEYKHILRRAVPKICHNKSGEINPTKIQALVEAYVKKFRKKRKLGLP